METRVVRVRTADGDERVLIELADFIALLDAARGAAHGLPEVEALVHHLGVLLERDAGEVDLDQFLAEYDAVHGEG